MNSNYIQEELERFSEVEKRSVGGKKNEWGNSRRGITATWRKRGFLFPWVTRRPEHSTHDRIILFNNPIVHRQPSTCYGTRRKSSDEHSPTLSRVNWTAFYRGRHWARQTEWSGIVISLRWLSGFIFRSSYLRDDAPRFGNSLGAREGQ